MSNELNNAFKAIEEALGTLKPVEVKAIEDIHRNMDVEIAKKYLTVLADIKEFLNEQ
jgi:hypothetical protein